MIFISYSRKNEKHVESIVYDVELLGYKVWFDKRINGGEKWWSQILNSIDKADIFIAIISKNYIHSDACKKEYEYALSLNKFIIPMLVDSKIKYSSIPTELSELQLVDYTRKGKVPSLKLAAALSNFKNTVAISSSKFPVPPKAPVSYYEEVIKKISYQGVLSEKTQNSLIRDIEESINNELTKYNTIKVLMGCKKRNDFNMKTLSYISEIRKNNALYFLKESMLVVIKKVTSHILRESYKYILLLLTFIVISMAAYLYLIIKNESNVFEVHERYSYLLNLYESSEKNKRYSFRYEKLKNELSPLINKTKLIDDAYLSGESITDKYLTLSNSHLLKSISYANEYISIKSETLKELAIEQSQLSIDSFVYLISISSGGNETSIYKDNVNSIYYSLAHSYSIMEFFEVDGAYQEVEYYIKKIDPIFLSQNELTNDYFLMLHEDKKNAK